MLIIYFFAQNPKLPYIEKHPYIWPLEPWLRPTNQCMYYRDLKNTLVCTSPLIHKTYLRKESILTENVSKLITDMIQHQNIIGWGNFLRGYVLSKWERLNNHASNNNTEQWGQKWIILLAKHMLDLHTTIWQDCNQTMHRKTEEQQLKAREIIIKPILPRFVRNHPDWHPNI